MFATTGTIALTACDSSPTERDACDAVDCGHGACEAVAGGTRCICEATWGGLACERCDEGYHDDGAGACAVDQRCAADSCGAGGLCDDAGGRVICQCDTGFAGERCDRCAAGYHDDGGWCAPDVACTDVAAPCSGHGACDDATGRPVCTCAEGWAGEFCDTCKDGWHFDTEGACVIDERCYNDSCGGFGACSVVSGLARCDCAPHHTGPYCGFCDVGYHADVQGRCVPDAYCGDDPLTCELHGACLDGGGATACACDPGWGGPTCARCAAGWHPTEAGACVPDDVCLATSCSGRGACVEDDTGIVCACDDGYAGDHCEACAEDASPVPGTDLCEVLAPCPTSGCGAHGTCGGAGATCQCDLGWAGDACDACALGYAAQGDACLPAATCTPEVCSGAAAGACDDATGVALCACNPAYAGANCEICAFGYHRDGETCAADEACLPDTCAAGGVCFIELGRARCACPPPAAGERCEACVAGYHLDTTAAAPTCVVDEVCSQDVCDHGTCEVVEGLVECTCDAGWAGARCKACAEGYHYDADGETCAPDVFCAEDGSSCSDHGLCIQGDGIITCSCDPGYAGEVCEACADGYEADGAGGCAPEGAPE